MWNLGDFENLTVYLEIVMFFFHFQSSFKSCTLGLLEIENAMYKNLRYSSSNTLTLSENTNQI